MAQKSKKARTSKKSTAHKPAAKSPRKHRPEQGKSSRTRPDQNRSNKRVTAPDLKASKKTSRSGSTSRSTARTAPVRFVPGGPNANLEKIDHIVVLMMENRSFDHMLGYLKLEGSNADVDGLDAEMSNSHDKISYPVNRLHSTVFEHDPGHGSAAIAQQLSNHNGGFVSNYAGLHPEEDPGLIMGYYNGSSVPVYDHLARNFCVCDRWFCSVPGPTWPNRLYAVAGTSPSKDNKKVPIYNLPSFVRHLDAARKSWAWYAHDIASLRLIDGKYRVGHASKFFWFDRRTWLNPRTFLDHAATGNLPAVSWIDPNFVDYSVTGPRESNDDHPPSDIMAGQDLVLKLYNAVVHSPAWGKTLLVIVYDEHGGFYDHVEPEDAPDDNPSFQKYGLRVPALVISPWVERGKVSHQVFDHTSIIKTILLRFCRRPDGAIPDMGTRVTSAEQLGSLLTLTTPREPIPVDAYQHLIERVAQWRAEGFKTRTMRQARGRAPAVHEITEFQVGLEKAKQRLRAEGLPEGQP